MNVGPVFEDRVNEPSRFDCKVNCNAIYVCKRTISHPATQPHARSLCEAGPSNLRSGAVACTSVPFHPLYLFLDFPLCIAASLPRYLLQDTLFRDPCRPFLLARFSRALIGTTVLLALSREITRILPASSRRRFLRMRMPATPLKSLGGPLLDIIPKSSG